MTAGPVASAPTGSDRWASDWRQRAACQNQADRYWDPWFPPPELFRPPEAALEVCQTCPVQYDCLIDALRTGDEGVRGGTTKKQRDALQRRRNRRACPVCSAKLPASLPGENYQVCVGCGLTWRARGEEAGRLQSAAPVDLGATPPIAFSNVVRPSLPPQSTRPL